MEKITEREQLNNVLDQLSDRFIHMVYIFAKSLLAEQKRP